MVFRVSEPVFYTYLSRKFCTILTLLNVPNLHFHVTGRVHGEGGLTNQWSHPYCLLYVRRAAATAPRRPYSRCHQVRSRLPPGFYVVTAFFASACVKFVNFCSVRLNDFFLSILPYFRCLLRSTVILDEVHERGMDSDFTLALLMFAMSQRKDLKLILMVRNGVLCQLLSAYLTCCIILIVVDLKYMCHYSA